MADIDEEFKEQLGTLLPWLLSPKNLTAKKIQGKPITGIELMEYAKVGIVITVIYQHLFHHRLKKW